MEGINLVILGGTVGKDPETRNVGENKNVASFPLATSKSFKKADGTREQKTEWHRIEAWGPLADFCANYVKKGGNFLVQGEIKTDTFDGKDGQKVYITKITAQSIKFLPTPQPKTNEADNIYEQQGNIQQPQRTAQPQPQAQRQQAQPQPQQTQRPAQTQQQSQPQRPVQTQQRPTSSPAQQVVTSSARYQAPPEPVQEYSNYTNEDFLNDPSDDLPF